MTCGGNIACCRVLYRRFTLAPRSLLLCEDERILGAVFIVEERRHGFVIRDDIPVEFTDRPALNRRIGEALIDALADLHLVPPAEMDLADLGRPDGFVERQLSGWTKRWHASQGGEAGEQSAAAMAPVLDLARGSSAAIELRRRAVAQRLPARQLSRSTMPIPAGSPRCSTWDMCTQGDPLADLGYILNYWVEPGDDPAWREIASMPTWRAGFPSRAEAIQRYAVRTGFDVDAVGWYQVFAAFKLAVIIQQIYARFVRGHTQDERFRHYYLPRPRPRRERPAASPVPPRWNDGTGRGVQIHG